jgi:glyoxylase-like metal-dependent hydrolase (beta-lactamase superfamily II)
LKARQLRQILQFTCIVLLGSRGVGSAQDAESFTLKHVGPNVWAAISKLKSKAAAAANTGFVIGEDGVVVIDTTASADAEGNVNPEPARHLLAAIRTVTKLPVKFVINTHYHFDHVAANGVFVDAGATVLAHRNTRGWIHGENLRMFGDAIKPQQKTFIDTLLPPAVVYEQPVDLYLGSRLIRILPFPGHTGGDSVVIVDDAKVIFTGDLLWRGVPPNMIDASTKPWIETLDALAKNVDATFVPGHGDVATVQDVIALRDYLATLQKLVADARVQGKSGAAMIEAVLPALNAKYGQWEYFNYLAERSILQMDAELSGTKRIPQPTK